ncbi:hypothetical protein Cagg_2503 [Chloroflexus aggregans DSM 9485]|uniref:Uncharacterized protein n=1 Tax=Chloroflexus aggregans (strain MD-66 / DSM 9485) TaxID=326427 RepID=B8G3X2_CHLAD|nr:hypothetical protein Cagg_2503 [Chloroflexus aggregans DSM 9485]
MAARHRRAPTALRGGTAPPYPDGWRAVRQHPDLCPLCPLCVNVLCPWWRHGTAVPLPPCVAARHRRTPTAGALCVNALCDLCPLCPLCVSVLCPWWRHGTAVPLPPCVAARHRRTPTGGALCVNISLRSLPPLPPLRERPLPLVAARHRRAPTALRGGTAPPYPDGWRAVRQHLFAIFAPFAPFALATFALRGGTASPCPYSPAWGHGIAVPLPPCVWARHLRTPTALRSGTAPPCPDGWRAVRQHPDLCPLCPLCVNVLCPWWRHGMPCPYRPAWGHGTAVPRRVTLSASAIFASFAPSAVFALAPFE